MRLPAAGNRVGFIAEIENIEVALAPPQAKIIVNARTGSVVMNQAVRLGPCAVAHGSLSVTVSSTPVISQPNAFSNGQTVQAEKTDIRVQQDPGILFNLPAGDATRGERGFAALPGREALCHIDRLPAVQLSRVDADFRERG